MINIGKYIDEPTADRLNELSGIHGLLYPHELKEVFIKRFGMDVYEGDIPDSWDKEKFGYQLCDLIQEWYDQTLRKFIQMSRRD